MEKIPSAGDVVAQRFQIEAAVDHGNFGSIFRAVDLFDHRPVAIKILRPSQHATEEMRRRFEREARLVAPLRHRNIVRVYDHGQTDQGLFFMAMEFLRGADLQRLVRHRGALHNQLVLKIALETLYALRHAHRADIVHRDLKPANLFLVADEGKGHVKVLDFGFAKALDAGGQSRDEITNVNTVVGTPAYMAPELIHKRNVGPAVDLYALGLIMGEMVLGRKLVQIDQVYETLMFQASSRNIKLPSEVARSPFGKIIQKAIEKKISRRYRSADELIAALRKLADAKGWEFVEEMPAEERSILTVEALENSATNPQSRGLPDLRDLQDDLRFDVGDEYSDLETDDLGIFDGPHLAELSSEALEITDVTGDRPARVLRDKPLAHGQEPATTERNGPSPSLKTVRPPTPSRTYNAVPREALEPTVPSGTPNTLLADIAIGCAIGGCVLGVIAFFFL